MKIFIDFYNNKRSHMSIGMQTPAMAHQQEGKQEKCWKTKVYRNNENEF
jgi:putative transposase